MRPFPGLRYSSNATNDKRGIAAFPTPPPPQQTALNHKNSPYKRPQSIRSSQSVRNLPARTRCRALANIQHDFFYCLAPKFFLRVVRIEVFEELVLLLFVTGMAFVGNCIRKDPCTSKNLRYLPADSAL